MHLPLQHQCYLLTRAPHQMPMLEQLLQDQGATTLAFPTLEIQTLPLSPHMLTHLEQHQHSEPSEQAEKNLWWIFNSANGVAAVMDALSILEPAILAKVISTVSVACVGPKTAEKLLSYGVTPVLVPEVHRAEELGHALLAHLTEQGASPATQTLVLWQAEQGLPTLKQVLLQAGYGLTVFPIYQTIKPPACNSSALHKVLTQQMPQGVIFTSPSSVRHFYECLTPALKVILTDVDYYSIGPVTSEAILMYLGPVAMEAEPYTLEALVTNLCAFVVQHQV